ncbi:MAG: hypothetical protein QF609_11845, partial [Gammaproteobacteria bacterium]|nr:hypothetical protein [Gammaproteobacteria bacterium]
AQFSRGRCTVTDNSTNDTMIYTDRDETPQLLKRDTLTLVGSGKIVLGQPSEVDDKYAIRYQFI